MQKRFFVFNEVYIVNHLRDILDYSCKWLVFKYSYRCKGPQNAFGFTSGNPVVDCATGFDACYGDVCCFDGE